MSECHDFINDIILTYKEGGMNCASAAFDIVQHLAITDSYSDIHYFISIAPQEVTLAAVDYMNELSRNNYVIDPPYYFGRLTADRTLALAAKRMSAYRKTHETLIAEIKAHDYIRK